MKKYISLFTSALLIFLSPLTTIAQSKTLLRTTVGETFTRSISEYFYTRTGNEILEPIKILGGVDSPGIYHIPSGTDLSTIIALAGGFTPSADPTEVRFTRVGEKTRYINIDKHMEKGKEIALMNGDTILVPRREGLISPEAATTLTVLLSIISVGLTAYVIDRSD